MEQDFCLFYQLSMEVQSIKFTNPHIKRFAEHSDNNKNRQNVQLSKGRFLFSTLESISILTVRSNLYIPLNFNLFNPFVVNIVLYRSPKDAMPKRCDLMKRFDYTRPNFCNCSNAMRALSNDGRENFSCSATIHSAPVCSATSIVRPSSSVPLPKSIDPRTSPGT